MHSSDSIYNSVLVAESSVRSSTLDWRFKDLAGGLSRVDI